MDSEASTVRSSFGSREPREWIVTFHRARSCTWAGAALVLLAAGSVGCPGAGSPPAGEEVVVYRFANATGEERLGLWDPWLVDMLVRDLWQADGLRVWSSQRSADFRSRLAEADRDTIVAAAREAGAGTVVLGRVERQDAGLFIAAELIEAATGNLRATAQTTIANPGQVSASVDSLRDQIWKALGVAPPENPQPITALTTENIEAYTQFVLGQKLYVEGKFLASIPHFTQAGRADVGFALAHYRRATASMQYVLASSNEVQSYLTLAWGKRSQAGERDRLAIEGLRALVFREIDEAEEAFAALRRRWPGDKEIAYFHALALEELGRDGEAVGAFEEAVEADPNFLPGWGGLANRAFLTRQPEKALRAARAGLGVNPAEPGLLEAEIVFRAYTGDLAGANEALDRALGFRRGERNLLLARVNLTLLDGDPGSALDQATTIRAPLSAASAELYRGTIRAGLTRLVAMADVQTATANHSAAAVAKWMTGLVLERNGDPGLAIQQFTEAANLYADFLDSREALGVAYVLDGELKSAETIATGIRELGAMVHETGWERHALRVEAAAALARERWDEAISLLQDAYELAGVRHLAGGYISDRPLYAEALAEAYMAKGDLVSAERVFGEIAGMAADRLHMPWIWLGAHVHLAELATRDRRMADAARHAAAVRQYWGEAGGQNQPLVDGYLDRLERVVPLAD